MRQCFYGMNILLMKLITDEMIELLANLNLNESFSIDFFGGNSYTFKRIQ
jgi:hypothetical protein